MNFSYFIAKRITIHSKRTFSKLIVRIAVAGISLGIVVMLLSIGIIRGFKSTIKDKLTGFSGDVQISLYESDSFNEKKYILKDPSIENFLKSNPKVQGFFECASKVSMLKFGDRTEPIVIKGVSSIDQYDFIVASIIKGKRFNLNNNECLISEQQRIRFNLDTGMSLMVYFADKNIKLRKLKVTGIYETGIEQIDRSIILSPIAFIRNVNDWSANQTGFYQVHLKDIADAQELQGQLNDLLPISQRANLSEEIYPELYDWIELLDVNAEVIIVLMLLVAGINMISALLILILERTSFIGILKSLGASNGSIRSIFAYNALYLIGLGLLIGNLITIAFTYVQQHWRIIKLDSKSYYMSYVPVDLHLSDYILLNIGCIAVCMFFVWIASFLVLRITALKAIQFN